MAEIPNSQPSSPAAGNVTKPASEKPLEILRLSPEPWLINGKAQLGVTDFYRIDSVSVACRSQWDRPQNPVALVLKLENARAITLLPRLIHLAQQLVNIDKSIRVVSEGTSVEPDWGSHFHAFAVDAEDLLSELRGEG